VAKIEQLVGRQDGVQAVTVKFASGGGEVDHDPALATNDDIVAAIARAGYVAVPSAF
jgi:copper chaperone CopZ